MVSSDSVLFSTILAATGTQSTPALPGGIIIAWIVCNRNKRNSIGGWLLLYYWQVYSGLAISAALIASNIQSYVPENFESGTRFALFLISALPALILILIEAAVASMLLSARTWDMLILLRWIILAEIVVTLISVAIDAAYFPDNQIFNIWNLTHEVLWLAYFFRSTRVRHVFKLHDWDMAVISIYPEKLKVAT